MFHSYGFPENLLTSYHLPGGAIDRSMYISNNDLRLNRLDMRVKESIDVLLLVQKPFCTRVYIFGSEFQ